MKKTNKKKKALAKKVRARSVIVKSVRSAKSASRKKKKSSSVPSRIRAAMSVFRMTPKVARPRVSKSAVAPLGDATSAAVASFPELLSKVRSASLRVARPAGVKNPISPVSPVFIDKKDKPLVKEDPGMTVLRSLNQELGGSALAADNCVDLPGGQPLPKFWSSPYVVDLKQIQEKKLERERIKSKRELIELALREAVKLFYKQKNRQGSSQGGNGGASQNFPVPREHFRGASHKIDLLSAAWRDLAQDKPGKSQAARPAPAPVTNHIKAMLSLGLVSILIGLPFLSIAYYQKFSEGRGKIFSQVSAGLKDVNFPAREFAADRANDFDLARHEIKEANSFFDQLAKEIPNYSSKITSGFHLLKAGENFAQAGEVLKDGLAEIFSAAGDEPITYKIRSLLNRLTDAAPKLSSGTKSLQKVRLGIVPTSYRSGFSEIKDLLLVVEKSLQRSLTIADSLLEILGETKQRRYLVLFQNNAEIRPTGGFIGSLALVDIYQGKIKNLEIPLGGPYDFKGSLLARVISPGPLHLVNPVWQLQDANWYFDFPASAQKVIWFYQKSGGPSVDGVIALNTFVLRDLLTITGPINLANHDKTIDADNFLDELQKSVEIEYQDKQKPKQIIADLAPKILEKVFALQNDQYLKVAQVLNKAAEEKNILVYAADERLQSKMTNLGWAGEVRQTGRDYLAVVNTNIAGGKTDSVISQMIRHQVEISPAGEVVDNLVIQRSHNGEKGKLFTGVKNIDFLRVYVPEGSELLEASGFKAPADSYFLPVPEDYLPDADWAPLEESAKLHRASGTKIWTESGRTVFGNWVQLEPGETGTVFLKYKLPFTLQFSQTQGQWDWLDKFKDFLNWKNNQYAYYSLYIQKQSGSWLTSLQTQLTAPTSWQAIWRYPTRIKASSDSQFSEGILDKDTFYGVIFTK